jgi:hypothetical protein
MVGAVRKLPREVDQIGVETKPDPYGISFWNRRQAEVQQFRSSWRQDHPCHRLAKRSHGLLPFGGLEEPQTILGLGEQVRDVSELVEVGLQRFRRRGVPSRGRVYQHRHLIPVRAPGAEVEIVIAHVAFSETFVEARLEQIAVFQHQIL